MTELTQESFFEFVRGNRYAVIHFQAAWNGHDVTMNDILSRQVPVDIRERIAFGAFDVDPAEHLEICKQHGIRNIPFLALYRDGTLVRTITGGIAWPEETIGCLRDLLAV